MFWPQKRSIRTQISHQPTTKPTRSINIEGSIGTKMNVMTSVTNFVGTDGKYYLSRIPINEILMFIFGNLSVRYFPRNPPPAFFKFPKKYPKGYRKQYKFPVNAVRYFSFFLSYLAFIINVNFSFSSLKEGHSLKIFVLRNGTYTCSRLFFEGGNLKTKYWQ